MLKKIYGPSSEGETRYCPEQCIGCKRRIIVGQPDQEEIGTSFAGRSDLTMRMGMRRFTRLTIGFSKKVANQAHSAALHFMWYNFGRIHKTPQVTPAMEACLTDHVWTAEEVANLLTTMEGAQHGNRGRYEKPLPGISN